MYGVRVLSSNAEEQSALFSLNKIPSDSQDSLEDVLDKYLCDSGRAEMISQNHSVTIKVNNYYNNNNIIIINKEIIIILLLLILLFYIIIHVYIHYYYNGTTMIIIHNIHSNISF